jgi:hypothetical protein
MTEPVPGASSPGTVRLTGTPSAPPRQQRGPLSARGCQHRAGWCPQWRRMPADALHPDIRRPCGRFRPRLGSRRRRRPGISARPAVRALPRRLRPERCRAAASLPACQGPAAAHAPWATAAKALGRSQRCSRLDGEAELLGGGLIAGAVGHFHGEREGSPGGGGGGQLVVVVTGASVVVSARPGGSDPDATDQVQGATPAPVKKFCP